MSSEQSWVIRFRVFELMGNFREGTEREVVEREAGGGGGDSFLKMLVFGVVGGGGKFQSNNL